MDNEERLIEERKKKVMSFILNNKNLLIILGLIAILILAWHNRTANVPNLKDITTGDYTLGPDLDPWLFTRYAKTIIENGSLPEIDSMRYVPLGFNTAQETMLLPYMMAYFHKFLNIFMKSSINYSCVIFPAFMFLLTIIAFFLFISKIFEKNKNNKIIALVSCLFLTIAPSLLSRTVAGIPEKESAGFFFMFLAFYFFIFAWKTEKLRNSLFLAGLAGLSTALMGLIWGGWIYIFVSIALFGGLYFIFGNIEVNKIKVYGVWLALAYIIPSGFSERYTLKDLIMSTSTGINLAVFLILFSYVIIFKTKIRENNFIKNLKNKIPEKAIALIFLAVAGIIISSITLGIGFIPHFATDIIFHLTQPYSDRLSFTVAENRQPYFDEWAGNFGPQFLGKFPLFFWLFFIGSIFLFYEIVKNLEKKNKLSLMIVYIIFIFSLVFSRYSQQALMSGENFASKLVYFGGFAVVGLSLIYLYYKNYKENKLEEFYKINWEYLLLLSFFITSIIGARSAIRLIMVLSAPAAGIAGYFVVKSIEKARGEKEQKAIALAIAGIVVVAAFYSIWFNYNATLQGTKSMVPSIYNHQWQKAMDWVRKNTSNNAVFSHWWDYGYWIQSIGERATVLDGGNAISYWNHLLGRHVLTGQKEEEALEFLYTHNATHLLIDSTDIGKYPAYSSIGGDENYDRYSMMPTFTLNEKSTQELKNETVYVYSGGMNLDKDFIWKDNSSGREYQFAERRAGIGAVLLPVSKNGEIKQPTAIFVYQNNQVGIPLKCVYFNSKKLIFEKEGYNGCLYIIPKIESQGIHERGAALFISEKSMNALWVKLYLFNESTNFKLVRNEPNLIIENIKSQGIDLGDFAFYGDLLGPIKIWEINYPKTIKTNLEYLKTDFPDSVRLAKDIF